MLNRWFVIAALVTSVCIAPAAHASDAARRKLTISGTVAAGEITPVFAPYGGMIDDFRINEGAYIAGGETMFTLGAKTLHAPCDGMVGFVDLREGADASYLTQRYGQLISIEPNTPIVISTDTQYAYNSPSTLSIHAGETVYVASRNTAGISGTGIVTSVDGKKYTVEMRDGNIPIGEGVAIFRDAARSANMKLGNGNAARSANATLTGEGTVARVYVGQGQLVSRGDPLVDLLGGSPRENGDISLDITSPVPVIVTSLAANAGDSISQGQLLARVCAMDNLRVKVSIPEADLAQINIGDTVSAELDGFASAGTISGTVESISGIATGDGEDTVFSALIRLNTAFSLRIGMRVSVMFN